MLSTSAGSTGEAVQGKSQLYGITWALSDVFNDNTLHLGQQVFVSNIQVSNCFSFKIGSSDWLLQNEKSRDSRGNQDYERNQCPRWCWDFWILMEQHKWAPPPIRNQHDMHNKPIWISRVCTCHTAGLQHQSSDLQEASEAFACNWKRQVKKMSRLKNGTTLIKISISAEVRKTQARQNSSWGDSKLLFWIRNGSLICQGREFFSKRFLS